MMWRKLWRWFLPESGLPVHLRRGVQGERLARRHLRRLGLKFLTANYRSPQGEIDLVFRDRECLVFVEVKTRSRADWVRPGAAVGREKRQRLIAVAEHYVRALQTSQLRWRFDVVEVLLEDNAVVEVRHLPNAFSGDHRWR